MKPTLWLRIASVLTFIHAVLHTAGGVFGTPAPGAQQAAVAAMKANVFPVMGLTRSYWSFHMGLGLAVSIFLTVGAVVFWQLGTLAKNNAPCLRPMIATFLVGFGALAVVSSLYFFAAPMIVEILIAACLATAIMTSKPRKTANR